MGRSINPVRGPRHRRGSRLRRLASNGVKVVGLGGIGTVLLPTLCRMLSGCTDKVTLTLVDGDFYERENETRQSFRSLGPKAEVKRRELAPAFRRLNFKHRNAYVNAENVGEIIRENDTVFLCVDNHKTRKIVSDHCRALRNVTLISGGNDLTDGNVQVYIRQSGKNITTPLDAFHPEIANPQDRAPDDPGCEEAIAAGNTQLLIANAAAAFSMLLNFWRIEEGLTDEIGETYFTLPKGLIQTFSRSVKGKEVKQCKNKKQRRGKSRER